MTQERPPFFPSHSPEETSCVAPELFRLGMRRVAASVHILTTEGPGGKAGLTVSSVCSVTDAPPTLLACLRRETLLCRLIKENKVFCLNTLPSTAQELADAFASRLGLKEMAQRFSYEPWAQEWGVRVTGSPALLSSRVCFDCRLTQIIPVSTHDVVFGEVLDVFHGPAPHTLLYANRHYTQLAP